MKKLFLFLLLPLVLLMMPACNKTYSYAGSDEYQQLVLSDVGNYAISKLEIDWCNGDITIQKGAMNLITETRFDEAEGLSKRYASHYLVKEGTLKIYCAESGVEQSYVDAMEKNLHITLVADVTEIIINGKEMTVNMRNIQSQKLHVVCDSVELDTDYAPTNSIFAKGKQVDFFMGCDNLHGMKVFADSKEFNLENETKWIDQEDGDYYVLGNGATQVEIKAEQCTLFLLQMEGDFPEIDPDIDLPDFDV